MDYKELEYLDNYENSLLEELKNISRSFGMMDENLLSSEDIDYKWEEFASDYMAEAVKSINKFPEFTIGCAAYVGFAVAKWWDSDWGKGHNAKYESLLGERGFDDMDDFIMQKILGYDLKSTEASILSNIALVLAQASMDRIRKEHIETQSVKAFYILSRTLKVMFKIGASIQLKRMGYKYQKVNFANKS